MRLSFLKHLTIPAKPGAPAPEGIKILMISGELIYLAKLRVHEEKRIIFVEINFMSHQTFISDLKSHVGSSVTLKGWVSNKREGKGIAFIILRDGTDFCQSVVTAETATENGLNCALNLNLECSVIITGNVLADEKQIGGVEIQVTHIEEVGTSENYPISKKEHGIEFLMDQRHLWLRSTRRRRKRKRYGIPCGRHLVEV